MTMMGVGLVFLLNGIVSLSVVLEEFGAYAGSVGRFLLCDHTASYRFR